MEPLPKERSDVAARIATSRKGNAPQWSRSRRSGATLACTQAVVASAAPQWSRSRRSGATLAQRVGPLVSACCLNGAAPEGAERPAATRTSDSSDSRLNGAAPEGAERHHVATSAAGRLMPQWSRSRRSGATSSAALTPPPRSRGLNGAAPEGAERRPRSQLAVQSGPEASMEPLPKERSDDARHPVVFARSAMPQWSRSRRSGATLSASTGDRADAQRLNGAAPEGAERRARLGRAPRIAADASMEPLPKERSDGDRCLQSAGYVGLNGAAPEGAERRRRSPMSAAAHRRLNGAAPEGAERRGPVWRSPVCRIPPQWSRSRRSGATSPATDAA